MDFKKLVQGNRMSAFCKRQPTGNFYNNFYASLFKDLEIASLKRSGIYE